MWLQCTLPLKEDAEAEKGVIAKGVFSLEKSLESLEALRSGRILICFPHSGGSLESLTSQNSRISRKSTFLKRPIFQKTPFPNPKFGTHQGVMQHDASWKTPLQSCFLQGSRKESPKGSSKEKRSWKGSSKLRRFSEQSS